MQVKKYMYKGEKNHNILPHRLNGFPLRGLYISWLGQVCVLSVCCVFLWVLCVCVSKTERKRNLKAPLSIWFLHHCGGITLSIAGSLGISSVCNISLIHTSPWALPCRTILSVPSGAAVTLHILWPSLKLTVCYPVSVRTTQGIKLSKLQFSLTLRYSILSHSCCFAYRDETKDSKERAKLNTNFNTSSWPVISVF